MSWRDRLQPASFRGVPFQVEGDELAAGRRVQVHEYPQRDRPFVEDLGKAVRRISFAAVLVGPDYMERRDALLEAIEAPGPGTLVHPQFGSLTVSVDGTCRLSHAREQGGLCRVQLAFVEAGELAFPSGRSDSRAKAVTAASGLDAASAASFADRFRVAGLPDFAAAAALQDLGGALDVVDQAMALKSSLESLTLRSVLASLLPDPFGLATRLQGLLGGLGLDGGTAAGASRVRGLARLADFQPVPRGAGVTPTRRQVAANQAAVAGLVRQSALAQAARTAAASDWPVRDDANAVRGDLARRFQAEEPEAEDDTVFRALSETRIATLQDIAARSAGAARLRTVTPAEPVPAVVLAYELYEDAGREAEIVARNRIRHPGFLPAEPLAVLNR